MFLLQSNFIQFENRLMIRYEPLIAKFKSLDKMQCVKKNVD
jgi:hypothetical protein